MIDMAIYYEWGFGWYYVIAILFSVWLFTMVYNKNYKIRPQITVGLITLALSFFIENVAVSQGIWNYAPGNWPVILWPSYFLSGMAAYQIVKIVDRKIK